MSFCRSRSPSVTLESIHTSFATSRSRSATVTYQESLGLRALARGLNRRLAPSRSLANPSFCFDKPLINDFRNALADFT